MKVNKFSDWLVLEWGKGALLLFLLLVCVLVGNFAFKFFRVGIDSAMTGWIFLKIFGAFFIIWIVLPLLFASAYELLNAIDTHAVRKDKESVEK